MAGRNANGVEIVRARDSKLLHDNYSSQRNDDLPACSLTSGAFNDAHRASVAP